MLPNGRKERETGQFSSKTAIVCLPPGTHLTDCHENKLESLQFQIIAGHVLLRRQKTNTTPTIITIRNRLKHIQRLPSLREGKMHYN